MVKKALSTRTHLCPSCGLMLDRDQNAALNILKSALEGTVGQTGTSESSENAWGEATATAVSGGASQQVASLNQESPCYSRGVSVN